MMQSDKIQPGKADHSGVKHTGAEASPWGLVGRAPLWKARHPTVSAREMASLPLLFWLVAELRPALTVQIGLGDGTSFLGLCQAIEKSQVGGFLFALPFGKEALSSEKAEQHGALYPQIARIGTPDDLPQDMDDELGDRPLQLLVLHRPLDETLRAEWLPRLAPNAVILVYSSATSQSEAQVAALLGALPQPLHRISMRRESDSLEMLLIDEALPERILHLAGNSPDTEATRALFRRLADGMQQQALAHKRLVALKKTEARLADLDVQLDSLKKETEAARQAETCEVSKSAALQAQVFDLTHDREHIAKEKVELTSALVAHKAMVEELKKKCEQLIQNSEHLIHEKAELTASLEARAVMLEELTQRIILAENTAAELDQLHKAVHQAETALSGRNDQLVLQKAELARLRYTLTKTEAQLETGQQAIIARDDALAAQALHLEETETELAELRDQTARQAEEFRHLTALVERHRKSAETTEVQITTLRKEAEIRVSRTVALEAEKNDLATRTAAQLSAREAALACLADDLESCRAAHAETVTLADRRQSELHILTISIRNAEEKIRQALELVAAKQAQVDALEAEKNDLATRTAAQLSSKQAEVDALHASTSWRVTAPIRKAKDGLRRLTGR